MPLAEPRRNEAQAEPVLEEPAPELETPLWWTLNSDEALLREALPEHRPEYC